MTDKHLIEEAPQVLKEYIGGGVHTVVAGLVPELQCINALQGVRIKRPVLSPQPCGSGYSIVVPMPADTYLVCILDRANQVLAALLLELHDGTLYPGCAYNVFDAGHICFGRQPDAVPPEQTIPHVLTVLNTTLWNNDARWRRYAITDWWRWTAPSMKHTPRVNSHSAKAYLVKNQISHHMGSREFKYYSELILRCKQHVTSA